MKYLANTTLVVYAAEVFPRLFSRSNAWITRGVLEEAKHHVRDQIAFTTVSEGLHVIAESKRKTARVREGLSDVDKELVYTALEQPFVLVSDDRKVIASVRDNGGKALSTPVYLEYLADAALERAEVIGMLTRLKPLYVRPKVIEVVLRRLKKRR